MRFRGAENEHRPWRRLFDGLQQRVEGFAGDLVRFVDDENFVAIARGLIADILAQFPHFIDAAIGRRVDFDDVDRSARRDFEATRADAAGLIRRAFLAIQASGDDARGGGLSRPALARKDVAVRDAVLRDGIPQSGFDVLLVQDIVKRLRTVFAGDDLIHGGSCSSAQAVRDRYARLRVIRGTRGKPLPLLPSRPGGVCSRPLHGARNLTNFMVAKGLCENFRSNMTLLTYAYDARPLDCEASCAPRLLGPS